MLVSVGGVRACVYSCPSYWADATTAITVYTVYGLTLLPRVPLLQLGKARTRRDIMEGWIIEGNEYQPGLLDILKAARTTEVGAQYPLHQVCHVLFSLVKCAKPSKSVK